MENSCFPSLHFHLEIIFLSHKNNLGNLFIQKIFIKDFFWTLKYKKDIKHTHNVCHMGRATI